MRGLVKSRPRNCNNLKAKLQLDTVNYVAYAGETTKRQLIVRRIRTWSREHTRSKRKSPPAVEFFSPDADEAGSSMKQDVFAGQVLCWHRFCPSEILGPRASLIGLTFSSQPHRSLPLPR
jgi:hypothetical protein